MRYEKSCGAVIFKRTDEDLQFLIISSKCDGHWGFPKGHVEEGESERKTAIREVKEETGLDIDLVEGFRTKAQYTINEEINKEVVYFIGKMKDVTDVTIQDTEVSAYRWVDYNKATELITYKDSKSILNEAMNFLSQSLRL